MDRKRTLIPSKKYFIIFMLMGLILTQSGCSLLRAPAMIIGGVFSLVGKIFRVIDKLPKPPPGVF